MARTPIYRSAAMSVWVIRVRRDIQVTTGYLGRKRETANCNEQGDGLVGEQDNGLLRRRIMDS